MSTWNWNGVGSPGTRHFKCGYCGMSVASEKAFVATAAKAPNHYAFIYICHACSNPTFFGDGIQVPGSPPGESVADVSDVDVAALFEEARSAVSADAFTAAVLACRKLLMHIAVAHGAKPGDSFVNYVAFLASKGFVPPNGQDWVDHIRKKGNEANHEIVIMKREEAEELVEFSEMLLKFIYEFPAKMKRKLPAPAP